MKKLTSVATSLVMGGLRWWWVIGSSAALALGAVIALGIYPEAGFARNPTGQFGWHLVGFALCVGISLALLQCLILALALKDRSLARLLLLVLWIPVTSGGIAAMIFPLWWVDADAIVIVLLFAPWMLLVYMGPGMLALGLAQWAILRPLFNIKLPWVGYTVTGAAIGAVLGLVVAMFTESLLPLEVIWAGMTGAAIGGLQALVLPQTPSDTADLRGSD